MNDDFVAVDLWDEFRYFLNLKIVVPDDLGDDPDSMVEIIVTIQNRAPERDDFPRIQFEEITVDVSGGAKPKAARGPRRFSLAPGSTENIVYECRRHELAGVEATANASISRREFFKVFRSARVDPIHIRETVAAYLKMIDKLKPRDRLDEILSSVEEPDPNTPVGALEDRIASVDQAIAKLNDFIKDIRAIDSPFGRGIGDQIRESIFGVTKAMHSQLAIARRAGQAADAERLAAASQSLDQIYEDLTRIDDAIKNVTIQFESK